MDEVNSTLLSATTILEGPQKVNSELSEIIKVGAPVVCLNDNTLIFLSPLFRSLLGKLSFFIPLQWNIH